MKKPLWKHVQVSVCGAAHLRNGLPCQDANGFLEVPGALICALSDGAGSARRAERGSELVVEAALDHFLQMFLRQGVSRTIDSLQLGSGLEMLASVRQRIDLEALAESSAATDYAATLLVAVIGPSRAVFYQVGDGVWFVSKNGILGAVTWPTSGEHVSETHFVTCDSASQVLQCELVKGEVEAVVGMTDGLERLALDLSRRVPHPGFIIPLARELRRTDVHGFATKLSQFLASDVICQRTDDDKTLAILLHEPGF